MIRLPNGLSYGTGANGERVCRGAQMGRRNQLPDDPSAPVKVRLERLRFTDGCYDNGGAYWGLPENLYCAYAAGVLFFARAESRDEAKTAVRVAIPGARFFR